MHYEVRATSKPLEQIRSIGQFRIGTSSAQDFNVPLTSLGALISNQRRNQVDPGSWPSKKEAAIHSSAE